MNDYHFFLFRSWPRSTRTCPWPAFLVSSILKDQNEAFIFIPLLSEALKVRHIETVHTDCVSTATIYLSFVFLSWYFFVCPYDTPLPADGSWGAGAKGGTLLRNTKRTMDYSTLKCFYYQFHLYMAEKIQNWVWRWEVFSVSALAAHEGHFSILLFCLATCGVGDLVFLISAYRRFILENRHFMSFEWALKKEKRNLYHLGAKQVVPIYLWFRYISYFDFGPCFFIFFIGFLIPECVSTKRLDWNLFKFSNKKKKEKKISLQN